ncbi:MAG: DUF421 domain-containing protein [Clostridia bacterium]|nr:DUF421 domain-containing protein [Clostridia bacterium]
MAVLLIRTILIYILLILVMRLSGKRQIGEIQLSELITTFLLSELASYPLTDPAIPFLHAVIPIITIVCLEIILSFLTTKSVLMKKLLDGKPSIIIRRGVLDQKEMLKMRLNLEDLLCVLRLNGISAIADVEYAILEQNGQISVFPKENKRALTPSDLSLPIEEHGIAHAIITDGHVDLESLKNAKKTKDWLAKTLRKEKIRHTDEIFLMTVDDSGDCKIVKKEGHG